jgi:ADP-ribose pyrophosphatase
MKQPFERIKTEEVYHGRVINVRVDTVRYENKDLRWEIVEMGNAVVVVPVLKKDTFVLLYQYRYTAQKFIWEFPAGRAEDGEDFEVCAQRELGEECGYNAKRLVKSLSYYPSPGVITEVMHLYFAFDLYKKNDFIPDEDEIIETKIVTAADIEAMIKRGEIQDAKTILAFYHYMINKETLFL